MKIILASASPRRKDLLEQIRLPFKIVPSNFDENIDELAGNPASKAEQLAYLKANEVANKVGEGLVIGADTIVVLGDKILGKPKNDQEAYEMLSMLSDREHQVITGVALIDAQTNIKKVGHEITFVKFRELTPKIIDAYISSGEPKGKAGAYAIQGTAALFVEKVNGCYSNVVGLPLMKLSKMLEEFRVYTL